MQVQSLLLTKHKLATSNAGTTTTTVPMEIDTENEQLACEKLLHERLRDMKQRIKYYEKHYVQKHGIKPIEMKRNLKIALVNYDYDSEILKRKYFHENPNEYQIDIATRLSDAKRELEKSKRELLELKYRIFYNKPSFSFDSIQTSMSVLNDNDQHQAFNKYEKLLQRKRIDFIVIKIAEAEAKFYQCQRIFDHELSAMWKNHRNLVKNQGMSTTLTNIIQQRFDNLTDRWRDIYNYRINYYLRNSYGDSNHMDTNKNDSNMNGIGFSSFLINDTTYELNDKQLLLLNRGATYVPPCQISIGSAGQSMNDILKKRYAPLKHQLTSLFANYHINIALSMEIQKKANDLFTEHFSSSIPSNLHERALYEKHLIQSIRCSFKKKNLILRRTADNMNTFYLGKIQDFEAKAIDYLTKSDAYKLLFSKDKEDGNQRWYIEFKEMICSMNVLLENLRKHKAVNEDLYNRLLLDTIKVKVPYLYFLPDVSKENGISLVPHVSSHSTATYKIGKYLNELMRPFVGKTLQSTTFRDEVDFMQKLNHYVHTERRLRPTTLFCTIKISNYYTMDTHKNMVDIVGYFLQDNLATPKLEQITIQTVQNLLHIFLYNNVFSYKDKVYTFAKGSPNTMSLTDTLANIYLSVWEKKILKQIKPNNELFGRFKDKIFFTWNISNAEDLDAFLQSIRDKCPTVQFQKLIGPTVPFLNAYIENRQGKLFSRIYHDPTIQSYTLPYVVGHSKLAHSKWLRSALIRAVCYCSSIEDFRQERVYLELAYLTNGYSLVFVEAHIQNFFNYFYAHSMRYSMDETKYDEFRYKWFEYITIQHELSDKLQRLDDTGRLLHFNYLYEYGPRCEFNQQFHRLWAEYFANHSYLSKEKLKVVLTTKNLHSLNALLAKEKSNGSIEK
ncbi:unnamed protein product [Rotaria magnacalcarata]|uniref:Helix-turn-helix domain-containing protein n=1 Tax=Rotaria magnacalcarata TaxID=392030 RepID=A0A816UP07_9BILA|nr:unnamed protein product [Rotaria magnacalcarata]CAF3865913.1 unnamed protein product [Rotaria magnacalcarata]